MDWKKTRGVEAYQATISEDVMCRLYRKDSRLDWYMWLQTSNHQYTGNTLGTANVPWNKAKKQIEFELVRLLEKASKTCDDDMLKLQQEKTTVAKKMIELKLALRM